MKGQLGLGDMTTIGIIFVVLEGVLAICVYIHGQVGTTASFASRWVSKSTLTNGQSAMKTSATWMAILAVVILSGIVIYILVNVFHGGGRGAV